MTSFQQGVGSADKGYNPVQKAISSRDATQCGYCTPGMVMAIYGALLSGTKDPVELDGCIDGNLCRCTGFRPILDAAHECASSPVSPPPEPAPSVPAVAVPLSESESGASRDADAVAVVGNGGSGSKVASLR